MSDEMLARRVRRLFGTLVIGGAALAASGCTEDKTTPKDSGQDSGGQPQEDAAQNEADAAVDSSGPMFW